VSGTGTFAHVTIKILEKEYNVACPNFQVLSLKGATKVGCCNLVSRLQL